MASLHTQCRGFTYALFQDLICMIYIHWTITHSTNVKLRYQICDPVCDKGSYSLFNYMYLATCNFTYECGITLKVGPLIPLT